MARALYAVAAILAVASLTNVQALGGLPSLPPLTLPSLPPPPNATAMLEGVKASLRSTAQTAVMSHLAYKPIMCPNNKPLVVCMWDVCKQAKSPCSANQVCVPDFCGRCGPKCVDIAVPIVDLKMPEMPKILQGHVPTSLPMPQAPCGLNQAINFTGTASNLLGKELKFACKECPENTVSTGAAVACSVCPPGTYGDRKLGKCRMCEPGSYSREFGATACKPCDASTFTPLPGSLVCVKCPFGFAAAEAGATKCKFTGFSS